jgi:hypothetical protein
MRRKYIGHKYDRLIGNVTKHIIEIAQSKPHLTQPHKPPPKEHIRTGCINTHGNGNMSQRIVSNPAIRLCVG